jgi:hypothetical protein
VAALRRARSGIGRAWAAYDLRRPGDVIPFYLSVTRVELWLRRPPPDALLEGPLALDLLAWALIYLGIFAVGLSVAFIAIRIWRRFWQFAFWLFALAIPESPRRF